MFKFLLPLAVLSLSCDLLLEQASAAAPPRFQSAEIDRLIKQLGSDDFSEREDASKALEAIGESALQALSEALDSKDLEIRHRVVLLLKRHQDRIRANIAKLKGRWKIEDTGGLSVTLAGKHIRDADLTRLKGLTGLEVLYLHDTRVTDNGLAHLKGHVGLNHLVLSDTPITGSGLLHLKGLVKLVNLNLSGTSVGDSGLVHLTELRDLKHLDLGGTRVTDAGLLHLAGLAKLWLVSLPGTRVTTRGVANLQKALPELAVFGP